MTDNVNLVVTADSNYITNYLSSSNTKVPLFTTMNMNFIDELNFNPATIYDLLTTSEEICPLEIIEGTKVYGDERVSGIAIFPNEKEIGFDTFPEDTDIVSWTSIVTTV